MKKNTYDLDLLAKQVMQYKGLQPEFSQEALQQLEKIDRPAIPQAKQEDLRSLLWCSIDNDDSRDLDQLTYAEKNSEGKTILWVAIADVDALVPKDSPLDIHAQINTTSVYTPSKIFPMLPEKLSTDLTSLNERSDRTAIVVKLWMDQKGGILEGTLLQALVRNHAQLTYRSVGSWLEGKSAPPPKVKEVAGLEKALLCQHEAAQLLKKRRHALGALTLESSEIEAKLKDSSEVILELPQHTFADQLIENFMIAANHIMATTLRTAQIPSLRRVVRIPKRWNRIVEIAASFGDTLPEEPDSQALDQFLIKRKNADPQTFPDISLTVIKLLGRGEYVVESSTDAPIGHFGLALSEYTHSTAPNRRFPDLISQRQCKAFIQKKKTPYGLQELQLLAAHCTQQEDAATKVERHMNKVAAAMLLSSHIGDIYKGIVTGAGDNGTWVRIFSPPVEGKIIQGIDKLDVGDRTRVKLHSVDIPRGFINFSAE